MTTPFATVRPSRKHSPAGFEMRPDDPSFRGKFLCALDCSLYFTTTLTIGTPLIAYDIQANT
eukprot:866720-Amphidinium_carterae.1